MTGSKSRGWSLVEAMVVVVTISVLAGIIIQTINLMSSGQQAAKNRLRATTLAERVAQRLQVDVAYGVRIFEEGGAPDLLGNMALSSGLASPGSRMPVRTSRGYFERDPAGQIETGNLLFLARHEKAQELSLSAPTPYERRIDRFRFVIWSISEERDGSLDLNRWASVMVARYRDIAGIDDEARRQQVTAALKATGIGYAWDLADTSSAGLYKATAENGWVPLDTGDRIAGDPRHVDLGMLGRRHVELAPNGSRTPPPVPFFATALPGFPHGLEIKIDGSGVGGLVLARLAVRTKGAGRPGYAVAERQIGFKGE